MAATAIRRRQSSLAARMGLGDPPTLHRPVGESLHRVERVLVADFSSNRHHASAHCLSMIFSENRYTLFGILLQKASQRVLPSRMSSWGAVRQASRLTPGYPDRRRMVVFRHAFARTPAP